MRRSYLLVLSFGIVVLVLLGIVVWFVSPGIELWFSSNKIAVIEVRGIISDTRDQVEELKRFRQNESVQAIILRIESPGGGVGPSQELYREVLRTVQSKPVVASLGGIAASGGYYIASAASHIVANPGTITGSIGVVVPFPNLQELFEKIGYKKTLIKSGQFKDMGDPGREMTAAEKELLQETVDAVHDQFVRHVAKGRQLDEEKVREIADGRILTGEMARELTLVDELGNFEDAVNAAARLGKIKGEPALVYAEDKRRSLLSLLIGQGWDKEIEAYMDGSRHILRYQVPY